jgi:tetratricopeptide (TPR) repeat protein
MRTFRFIACIGIASASAVQAQPPNMQAIAQALGVSCGYCHVAERGTNAPEPKKDIARSMMAMTRDINSKVQAATGLPGGQAVEVQCVTCHRGVPIPRPLADVLAQTLKEKGAPAAMDQYRELRKQFYGRAAYDFGEDTLIGIARAVTQSRPGDSIALLQLNLEFFPHSANTYEEIGFAYTRKLDDDSAIQNLEKALEIEPNNGVIRGQLEQLKSYQRARQRRQQSN